jgi:hypothetical protein
MAAKLTRLTHKIAIQLHLVAESCTICSSRPRRPVRKHLDTPSYYTILHYNTLNQWHGYEQCYHLTEGEIKKIPLIFDLPSYNMLSHCVNCQHKTITPQHYHTTRSVSVLTQNLRNACIISTAVLR